eukprot:366048-Chlamydomonas_euryale.AAC.5
MFVWAKVLDLKAYSGKHKDSPKVTCILGSVTDREKVDEAVAGMNTGRRESALRVPCFGHTLVWEPRPTKARAT